MAATSPSMSGFVKLALDGVELAVYRGEGVGIVDARLHAIEQRTHRPTSAGSSIRARASSSGGSTRKRSA